MPDSPRPLLAICIPTHDGRAAPLAELFERLLPQVPGDGSVEVCVSDNASADGSAEVVAARRAELGDRLSYRRNERDLGFTANLFGVVEMASAEYCWLLSSDDAPTAGAVAQIVAALRANPGVSGAHVGFYRRGMKDLDLPGVDWPPDILPREVGTRRIDSAREYAGECGVLSLPVSLSVVHRDRWREVARDERAAAERTPIVAQVHMVGRLAQRHPGWLWIEEPCTLLREAPTFLEEGNLDADTVRATERGWAGSADYAATLRRMTAELDRAWGVLHGRGSEAHRELMRTFGRFILHPAAAVERKLRSRGRLRDELQYAGFIRHFRHSRDFLRKTVPLLLTPTARLRPAEDAGAAGLAPGHAELTGASGERVAVPAHRLHWGRGAWFDIDVHNAGDRTLSFTKPYFAALYARWRNLETDEVLPPHMYTTPLHPAVRPGATRRLQQLLTVPEPGPYELMADLFSRATGRSLTGGRPVIGQLEVVVRDGAP